MPNIPYRPRSVTKPVAAQPAIPLPPPLPEVEPVEYPTDLPDMPGDLPKPVFRSATPESGAIQPKISLQSKLSMQDYHPNQSAIDRSLGLNRQRRR